MSKFIPTGMGWIPDLPDPRDYTHEHEAVLPLFEQLKRARTNKLPDVVDLRSDDEGEYLTTVENQGHLNSSSAFAILSLVEYFERRVCGHTFEGSKLFLYRATRNHLQKRHATTVDTGSDLRTTLKALISIGVPPEEYWPYDVNRFDEEPRQFLYKLAKPLSRVRFFRLDVPKREGPSTWRAVKSFLAAGFPVAFGFSVPTSLTTDSDIPYRPELDGIRGGQAALAIGYKQHHFGRNQHAVLIRSSWGSEWGDNGNGWLPAAYVRRRLAINFWTVISQDWVPSRELSRPTVVD